MADQEPTLQAQYAHALAQLTPRQAAFVEEYLTCLNASEAARRAKYSERTAYAIGYENLRKPEIAAAISAGFALRAMAADEVLARIADIARGSMGDFVRVDEEEVTLTWSLLSVPQKDDGEIDIEGTMIDVAMHGNVKPTDRVLHTATIKRAVARLDLMQVAERGKMHLIKKYTLDEKGKTTIELYPALEALNTLAKHHGLLVDRVQHSGKIDVTKLSDDELRAIIENQG